MSERSERTSNRSSGHVVLDDTLLLEWLIGDFAVESDEAVATTAAWWFRLARALLRDGGGALSRQLATSPEDLRRRLLEEVLDLPETVTVLHPRDTIAIAAGLSARHGLNLLAADALAVAQVLAGRLLVTVADDGPRLRAAATALDIDYRAVPSGADT
ncbi:hypothetical protein BH24ACT3_BH24ACT3_12510 [soil metagenome]